MKLALNKTKVIQVGVWQSLITPEQLEVVWFNDGEIHQLNINHNEKHMLQEKIQQSFSKNISICLITAVLPHQLLRKSLFFSDQESKNNIERKCLNQLEQISPVPLEDLWFDYMQHHLTNENKIRIDLFAIVKKVGQSVVESYKPLNINVLDAVVNALKAAFLYGHQCQWLSNHRQELSSQDLYLYQYGDESFALWVKKEETLIERQKIPLDELKQRFCHQHNFTPRQTYVLCHNEEKTFHKLGEVCVVDVPLIPLGCALWQGAADKVIGG